MSIYRMETTFWEESHLMTPSVKIESIGYSATQNSEDEDYGFHGKKKMSRDPLSHRIIEKRRRDRMNSCLADLSRLIPHEYIKKGRGRVEKTEIIEMAIRRIKHLTEHSPCKESECHNKEVEPPTVTGSTEVSAQTPLLEDLATSYKLGFAECLNETVHFLVQVEGMMASDPFCTQLRTHLTRHCDRILQSDSLCSRLCIVKDEPSFKSFNNNDNDNNLQQNCTTSNTNFLNDNNEEKNINNHFHHQSQNTFQYQQQQTQETQQHQQLGTNQICCSTQQNGAGSNQLLIVGQQQQQDSSSETSTTGRLSTISNNHSPTSSNSEKTHPGDNEKLPSSTASVATAAPPSYKFKNRIQKRFERGGTSSTNIIHGSTGNSGSIIDDNCTNDTNRVPIFVLAPRGNYYLPMSLDYGQLPNSYQERVYGEQSGDCILLHPVTISVDFRGCLDAMERG